ncbi:MAG: TonB-dependent receptor [Chitinophagaceae bacterium]|nr:TonB-dependent receptor [Chitinophagaceae bacterium]
MKYTFLLLTWFVPFMVLADTKISGVVKDQKGETLIGVNVSLIGSYDGATSNVNGEYQFETSKTDSAVLKASYTGYSTQEIKVKLTGKDLKVDFTLKEKVTDLKAVVITAGAFEASDEKKGTVLKALDIVTTAGSNGDSYGALKTLPGTQQTNDREGLFVRGGTGAETQTFIDGTWVRNAFSASIPDLGARGRFNPFIFKGTVFSSGGYSALYGQALSSAVILESIDLPERSSANFNLSSVGLGASYQQLSKSKKSSWGIGYNYVNLTPYFALIKQNIQYKTAPTVHQVDLNYRVKTSKSGMLKFYGYLNLTNIDIQRSNITSLDYLDANKEYQDRYAIKNQNIYGNLSYKNYFKNDWKLNLGACVSYNHDDIATQILTQQNQLVTDSNFYSSSDVSIENQNNVATVKVVLDKGLPDLNAIRFGAEYIYNQDKTDLSLPVPINAINYQTDEHYKALFAEGDIYLTNNLAGKIGVRAEHSSVLNAFNLAPRASMAYKVNKAGQLSVAYGIFYQKPEQQYIFKNSQLGYMRADHYIVNYQFQPKDRILRAELYYKKYHDLIKTNSYGYTNAISNLGKGYAQGFEVFYRDKKTLKGIDFWISYSFIDTKREFLNYQKQVQPDFVATHTANFVFKKFWIKKMFGINGTYTFATGRPYYNPNLQEAENFMSEKTQPYHNFSISANYLRTIKKVFSVWVLSVNNPFGFKQVYGYNYAFRDLNQNNNYFSKPITPPAKQFIFLGVFLSWGIDRSQEAIDNNL